MRVFAAVLRILAVIAIVAAVSGQFTHSAGLGPINPTRFFGYFTIQSNLLTAVVLVIAAIAGLSRRTQREWIVVARACITTYMATTGVVFALLLRESTTAADFNLPWADDVLHVWVPLYVVADWVLFGDRPPVAWKRFWIILVYPLVWAIATLLRGSLIDGFFAYPFLDPAAAGGVGHVVVYIVAIAGFIGIVGVLMLWMSRARILKA
jgi:hypothetical protein